MADGLERGHPAPSGLVRRVIEGWAGAGIESAHRAPTKIGGKLFLELLHFRATGDPAGAQYVADHGDGRFVYSGFGEGKKFVVHDVPRFIFKMDFTHRLSL